MFKDALAKTKNFEGVSGTISMQANREPIKSPLALLEVKGGKFVKVTDWYSAYTDVVAKHIKAAAAK